MASDNAPSNPGPSAGPPAFQQWFNRLGISGKLLAIGGAVGIIGAFLPLYSMSGDFVGIVAIRQSRMVVEDWRGTICLLGYIAALVFAFLLYTQTSPVQKGLAWAAAGVGAVTAVLSVLLMISYLNVGSSDVLGISTTKISVGIGGYLNVLAGAAVAAGGALKAREEKLF